MSEFLFVSLSGTLVFSDGSIVVFLESLSFFFSSSFFLPGFIFGLLLESLPSLSVFISLDLEFLHCSSEFINPFLLLLGFWPFHPVEFVLSLVKFSLLLIELLFEVLIVLSGCIIVNLPLCVFFLTFDAVFFLDLSFIFSFGLMETVETSMGLVDFHMPELDLS